VAPMMARRDRCLGSIGCTTTTTLST
jgi:hypothetical protein